MPELRQLLIKGLEISVVKFNKYFVTKVAYNNLHIRPNTFVKRGKFCQPLSHAACIYIWSTVSVKYMQYLFVSMIIQLRKQHLLIQRKFSRSTIAAGF